MRRLMGSSVLVVGLGGLGAEVAKNVILAGARAVTLHDPAPAALRDLGAQFYLAPGDVGRPRAEACRDALAELNPAVAVAASAAPLDDAFLSTFTVVVGTQLSYSAAAELDAACRRGGAAFVYAAIRGVFATVFCDFGPAFEVSDVDGEEPHTAIISGVTPGPTTLVHTVEDERLEFDSGELVAFSEVVGMPELMAAGPVRVRAVRPHSLELEVDSTAWAPYVGGGLATQVKEAKTLAFEPMAASIAAPGEFLLTDFSKLDRPAVLHLGARALDAFAARRGRLPAAGAAAEADELLADARALNTDAPEALKVELGEGNERVLRALAAGAAAELSPMAAAFGGVVGQEVVKAASGKFHPLHQWLHFDSMESLPGAFFYICFLFFSLLTADFAPADSSALPPAAARSEPHS
jgi:ubiquitin-activating enzyme E1